MRTVPVFRSELASIAFFGALACGASSTPGGLGTTDDGDSEDGDTDTGSDGDATPIDLTPYRCAYGQIDAPATSCFAVTPITTGASDGENAGEPSYAITPDGAGNGKLLLYFNGTGAHPAQTWNKTRTANFYTAATALGYSVIAISYTSENEVGEVCQALDACYWPTRLAKLYGTDQDGSAIVPGPDEGAFPRLALLLQWLIANDPDHDWSRFYAGGEIVWSSIATAGHSQGGGTAAAVGKLYGLERVIQLSSTCDRSTDDHGVTFYPSTWTSQGNGVWHTDPTTFWGLGTKTTFGDDGKPDGGDTACFSHLAIWNNLGMQENHRNDGAVGCAQQSEAHNWSIGCLANYDAWQAMMR